MLMNVNKWNLVVFTKIKVNSYLNILAFMNVIMIIFLFIFVFALKDKRM